jgi:hypothetical protein
MYVIILNYSDCRTTVRKLPDNVLLNEEVEEYISSELGMRLSDVNYMTTGTMVIDIDVPNLVQEIDLL